MAPSVILLQPPAAFLSGEPPEDPRDLRFVVGQAIAAALPSSALLFGLPPGEAPKMWSAVLSAFGPTELGRTLDPAAARMAESFWSTIPARMQRRLQELLAAASMYDFDPLLAAAKQSGRRVGMFLTGDFAHAVRVVLSERGADVSLASEPRGLERLCAEHPALADLLRLAVSPEYADARWRIGSAAAPRITSPDGRGSGGRAST